MIKVTHVMMSFCDKMSFFVDQQTLKGYKSNVIDRYLTGLMGF